MFELKYDELFIDASAFSLEKLIDIAEEEVSASIAEATNHIQRGEDADGARLKSYSPSYRLAIEKGYVKGRNGVHKVEPNLTNLTVTGDMLDSRKAQRTSDGAIGTFQETGRTPSNAEIASHLEALGYDNWHVFSEADQKRIEKRFDDAVAEMVDKSIVVRKRT